MKMSVGQAGQCQTPAQVNHPGVATGQRPYPGIVADSQKTAIADNNSSSLGEVGVLSK